MALPPLTDHRSPALDLPLPSLDNWQEQDVPRMHEALVALDAFLTARPNLLPYGGFEFGLQGWENLAGWEHSLSEEWGDAAVKTAGGTYTLESVPFAVEAGATYTITGDSMLQDATGGSVYFDLQFLDGGGDPLPAGPHVAASDAHGFGGPRTRHAVAAVAPADAVHAIARFVADTLTGTAPKVGCRMVKVEHGPLPATGYTSEGTLASVSARLAVAEDTLANTGTSLVPAGVVVHFAASLPPSGWLAAGGAAISRTAYAALFAAIGTTYGVGDGVSTFNLPDLRGEFIRGADDGRGVDAGRITGSAQADALGSHQHDGGTLTAASGGAHTHSVSGSTGSDGAHTHTVNRQFQGSATAGASGTGNGANMFWPQGVTQPSTGATSYASYGAQSTVSAGAHTHTVSGTAASAGAHAHTVSGSTGATGVAETRPRNLALLACIKF